MKIVRDCKGKCSILNIGAGKENDHVKYLDYIKNMNYFMVNIDKNYFTSNHPVHVEVAYEMWLLDKIKNRTMCVSCDIFEFLERYKYRFDFITMYRFFEHIPRDKLLYFIYLLSTITEIGGIIDIIAPNYQILAQKILDENPFDPEFDKHDILISTEMFNEPSDPHNNITTPDRIKRLFEYEERFEVEELFKPYLFDDREIYFRTLIRRI